MKILYHHRTQAKDAEGVHIREIVKSLQNLGHGLFIVSPLGIDIFCEELRKDSNLTKGCKIKYFWNWLAKYSPQIVFEIMELLYNFNVYLKIKKIITKNKIDLIYERYAFFCWATANLASKFKIPYIIEVNEISEVKRTRGQILVNLANRIEKNVLQKANSIIVVSEFLKEQIQKRGINPEKIYVISNAVDGDKFNPEKFNSTDLKERLNIKNRVVLGFVGNFVKWHNFELLLEAFKNIVSENRKNLFLLLVGDGPMKHELESKVADMGISKNVFFTGNLKHSEIPAYIQVMDVCIIPHSNEFRSPIKLFEYMAMNKPVIAPKVAPIEEAIADNINGSLFSLGDKDSLENRITTLVDDREKRRRIGCEARRTILSKFLWKHNAEKIIEIYRNIIEKNV